MLVLPTGFVGGLRRLEAYLVRVTKRDAQWRRASADAEPEAPAPTVGANIQARGEP
jgi:hypothetical protein